MPPRPRIEPPPDARATTVRHRVPFYETDAMGIVHHANYVRFLELARLEWMDEHDRPYAHYMDRGYHIITTAVALRYHRPARFDDVLEITTWLQSVQGVRLCMAYALHCGKALLASGTSEHAFVDREGRPRRLPADVRETFAQLAQEATRPGGPRRTGSTSGS